MVKCKEEEKTWVRKQDLFLYGVPKKIQADCAKVPLPVTFAPSPSLRDVLPF